MKGSSSNLSAMRLRIDFGGSGLAPILLTTVLDISRYAGQPLYTPIVEGIAVGDIVVVEVGGIQVELRP